MIRKQSIYSNRCWLNGNLEPATVSYQDGIITEIRSMKSADSTDIGDNILMPGIIDAHVHINEPGRTQWEGFETGTAAAAKGGITTLIDMPLNSIPVTTNVSALNDKVYASVGKLHVNCGFYGGLIPQNQSDLPALIQANVFGIKCFLTHSGIEEFPNVTETELDKAMQVIKQFNIPLLAHCEINTPVNAIWDDPGSYTQYLSSRPKTWETNAVALMINLCRKHDCKIHIVHVSADDSLALIKSAKAEGLPITAETCPHYIYFNAENIPDNHTVYKCAPPIRDQRNNESLKQGLHDGTLDLISSDHSPAPPELKQIDSGDLKTAWGGIAGLQFLLPVSWTSMKNTVSLSEFIPLLTSKPARFLNLHHRKGEIKTGYDADLTVWNPDAAFIVKKEDIRHRHPISPYIGVNLSGKVLQTIVNGALAYHHEQDQIKTRHGKIILNEFSKTDLNNGSS